MSENVDELNNLAKMYFPEYMKTLRKETSQMLNKKAQNLRVSIIKTLKGQKDIDTLIDFTALMLFYGTKLTCQDISNLKTEDIFRNKKIKIKISERGEFITLDEESSEFVKALVTEIPKEQKIFFATPEKPYITIERFYKLINEYPDNDALKELSHCFPIYTEKDYEIIPTPLRLNVDMRYTGKGVTIAFIDSGFYPHPDITQPVNRVLAYVNIPNPDKDDFYDGVVSSWHGMQTSLSATGNGFLSNGLYRGIASDANLVLLKVRGEKGIDTEHIIDAIKWCITNKDVYNIKIMNISLGLDEVCSYVNNDLCQAAEAAVQAGIVVLVAAGNDGDSDNIIGPPANAPSVITVGGLDDKNKLDVKDYGMYRSSYGYTADGLLKPDLIAPGIWVAAPILPSSKLYKETEALNNLKKLPDDKLKEELKKCIDDVNLPEKIQTKSIKEIREAIRKRINAQKIVGTYYQHVDGTSFSAPIVASVVAQMIEANPLLNPRRIKQILMRTTDRLFNVPREKQGSGLIHARKAVKEALNDIHRVGVNREKSPYVKGKKVTFYFFHESAKTVSLTGDWNNWKTDQDFFVKEGQNLWKLEKEFEEFGSYRYKFVTDGDKWWKDTENDNKEPDSYGDYNNRLNIYEYKLD